MSQTVIAIAAREPRGKLERFEYSLPDLGPRQVEIAVEHCGICHSDLSMWNNDWGNSTYPLVAGHEATGKVVAVGDQVKALKVGDSVGVGWYSRSCLQCRACMSGDHNLCATAEQTIVGRHGGFANLLRVSEEWAIKLPEGLDIAKAGPLFCGGITVFNPLVQFGVLPIHRVGVVGIGGLGHMALRFLSRWGCHVTAFTSSESKRDEAMALGANDVVSSVDATQMKALARSFDFILVTVNVNLDWPQFISLLAPKGRLHFVGVVLEPIPVPLFPMLVAQGSVSGSPLGSPVTTATMLDFCRRHEILPTVEFFPMSQAEEAFRHLQAGKARYRIVLKNDLA